MFYADNLCVKVIETRLNSMFELATQDEIDKLRTNEGSSDKKSSEDLQLEDLEVNLFQDLIKSQYFTFKFRISIRPFTSKGRCFILVSGASCCSWLVPS